MENHDLMTQHCESCGAEIVEGVKCYACADGPVLCENCAPTLGQSLEETEARISGEDDNPELTAEVATRIARRLADGAAVSDKDVW